MLTSVNDLKKLKEIQEYKCVEIALNSDCTPFLVKLKNILDIEIVLSYEQTLEALKNNKIELIDTTFMENNEVLKTDNDFSAKEYKRKDAWLKLAKDSFNYYTYTSFFYDFILDDNTKVIRKKTEPLLDKCEDILAENDINVPDSFNTKCINRNLIAIEIEGDWKHSHLYADSLLREKYNLECIGEIVVPDDNVSDWYTSIHYYDIPENF